MPYRIRQWWMYKTQMEKVLMVLLAFAIFIIVVLASVMKHDNVQRKSPETCSNLTCLSEALKLKRSIDPKTNPCNDFYQYVCGNFLENSNEEDAFSFLELQEKQLTEFLRESINTDDHAVLKVTKRLFQTCTDNDGFNTNSKKTLIDALVAAGGWPVLEGDKWNEERFDWKNASYVFAKMGYFDELIVHVNVDHDVANKSNYVLEVVLADVYDYLYGIIGLDKAQIMSEIAVVLGAEDNKQIVEEMNLAHNFQQALQAIVYYKPHDDHPHYKYTIAEYQKLCDSINWLEFINNMLHPWATVTSDETAWFPPPEIFNKWFAIVLNTPKRVQANYMMWKVVEKVLPYLSRELQYAQIGLQKKQLRNDLCLETALSMGFFYPTQIFLHKKYVSEGRKNGLLELVGNMKKELVQIMNRTSVLNVTNKAQALDVVKSLRIEVVPSDHYLDNDVFNKLADKKVNLENATFLDVLAEAMQTRRGLIYLHLYNSSTLIPNIRLLPIYRGEENIIYGLGLATHKTYFDEKRPNYINYAIIGSILEPEFNNVLQKNTGNETEMAIGKCMSEGTYKNYQALILGRLAIGQQLAYNAYQDWVRKNGKEMPLSNVNHTPNQLFWISSVSTFCNPHGTYRKNVISYKEYVLRVIRNSARFAKDFNCPPGSEMSSTSKCSVV